MVAIRERLPALDRLAPAGEPAPSDMFDWTTPIDRTRLYICETLSPLYYTAVYRDLGEEHRLRYNQLTGILAVELIALLESEFLDAALAAVEAEEAPDSPLRAAVVRFARDERRHAAAWAKLTRLSEPGWYAGRARHIVRLPPGAAGLLRFVARHPIAFPVVFWVQLAQEERSIEISRRCMRMPADRIEPRYAGAFREHLVDETRHVQVDRHLIERFYAKRPAPVRRMTARLFRAITRGFLLAPAHSTSQVIAILAREYPELVPLLPRIRRELRALEENDDYHRMMYSRRTTPVTFGLFDRFEEFRQMRHVLRSYRPERQS
ncbi:MAG TPA: diiron oxygenase [Vicinamibacterales bacterium]|nr:diiron oxygenase [Vicinamibacterales bacterium]